METRGINLTESLVCTAPKAREMGTWGVKLQSTLKKRGKRILWESSEVLNLASRTVFLILRGTDWTSAVLRGLVQWSTVAWRTGKGSPAQR
eukprot:158459-Rhodomonas_salina.1